LRLPDLAAQDRSIRWLFRANHIYLLMAGLLNLAAVHAPSMSGWRARAQGIGSALLLLSPVLLVAAFIREPATPEPGRPLTHAGIIALAAGTVLHGAFGGRERPEVPIGPRSPVCCPRCPTPPRNRRASWALSMRPAS